jgi:hypothetical protein
MPCRSAYPEVIWARRGIVILRQRDAVRHSETSSSDRMFDLVTLLFCGPEGDLDQASQERLWSLLEGERQPAVLRAYLAHMALRLTSWSVVHHDDATTTRWLERSWSTLDRVTPARSARLPPAAGAAPSAAS